MSNDVDMRKPLLDGDAINVLLEYTRDTEYLPDDARGMRHIERLCHHLAAYSGWWDGVVHVDGRVVDKTLIASKLALIHSEVSEALEGVRKGLMDTHLPHRKMVEVELADTVIRIFDLAGAMGLDVTGAVIEKLAYNQQREDHKRENRAKPGGKAI